MPVVCYKPFSLTVNPFLSAYWTLDEAAANVPRVDSVTGLHLEPLGPTAAGAPGLYANGVQFEALAGSADYTASSAKLAFNGGSGSSIFGWFKITTEGHSSALGGPLCSLTNMAGKFVAIAVGSSDTISNNVRVSTASDFTLLEVSLSVWTFFHLFYDAAQQKYGFSLGAGGETLLPTIQAPTPAASGGVDLNNNWTSLLGSVTFDEIGVVANSKLDAAQVLYLYNSGLGRTWPVTIP